jgi:hypothetical protein
MTYAFSTYEPITSTGFTSAKLIMGVTGPSSYNTYEYLLTSENTYIDVNGIAQYNPGYTVGTTGYDALYCIDQNKTIIYHQGVTGYVLINGNWCYGGTAIGGETGTSDYIILNNIGNTYQYTPATGTTGTAGIYNHPIATGTPLFNIDGDTGSLLRYDTGYLARFTLEESWANIGHPPGPAGDSSTLFPTTKTIATTVDLMGMSSYNHYLHQFTPIPGTGYKLSSVMVARLSRTAENRVDTFNGGIYGLSFDVHAQLRGIGYGPNAGSGSN